MEAFRKKARDGLAIFLCMTMLLGSRTAVFALAPPTEYPSPAVPFFHGKNRHDYVRLTGFLSRSLGTSRGDIEKCIERQGVPAHWLKPLLNELEYMIRSKILMEGEMGKWRREPLDRVIKSLLALAWHCEHTQPWKIIMRRTPSEAWDSIRLKNLLETRTIPDKELASLVEHTFKITRFSMKDFFTHTVFDGVAPEARARIQNLCSSQSTWNNPHMMENLSLILLNPYFSDEVTALVEKNARIPGLPKLLNDIQYFAPRAVRSKHIGSYHGHIGSLHEMAALEPTLTANAIRIVELGIAVTLPPRTLTQIDALGVKNERMVIVENKMVDLSRYYRLYARKSTMQESAEQVRFRERMKKSFDLRDEDVEKFDFNLPVKHLLRRAWIMANIERKVKLFQRANEKGLLVPLLHRCGCSAWGGIVFSVSTHDDKEFRKDKELEAAILEEIQRLSLDYKIPIEAHFFPFPPLVVDHDAMVRGEVHPFCPAYALSPKQLALMRYIFYERRRRENLERFQREIQNEKGISVGLEALRILMHHTHSDRGGLVRLIGEFSVGQLLEWCENLPEEIMDRLRQKSRPPETEQPSAMSLENSPLGTIPDMQTSPLDPQTIALHKARPWLSKNWKWLFKFQQEVSERAVYEKSEEQLWEILTADTWLVSAEEWPTNPAAVVLHLADGRILLNKSFFQDQDPENLLELAVVEETLLEMHRRNVPQADRLLREFQQRFAEPRKVVFQRAETYRKRITATPGGDEATLQEFRERTARLEDQVGTMVKNLPKELRISPQIQEKLTIMQKELREHSELLARPLGEKRAVRASHKALIQAFRRFRRELQQPKPPHAIVPPATAASEQPIPTAMREEFASHSLKPLLDLNERGNISSLLHTMRREMAELNERFSTISITNPSCTEGVPVFDISLLNTFEQEMTPHSFLNLIDAYEKTFQAGVKAIAEQTKTVMTSACANGFPVDIEGNPDLDRGHAMLKPLLQKSKKMRKLLDSWRDTGRWPGIKKWQRLYQQLVDTQNNGTDAEEKTIAMLTLPGVIFSVWELGEPMDSHDAGTGVMNASSVPAFRDTGESLKALAAFIDQKTTFAVFYWRWTKDGYSAEEKEKIHRLSETAAQNLVALKETVTKEPLPRKTLQDLDRLVSFLQELPDRPYSMDLMDPLKNTNLLAKEISTHHGITYGMVADSLLKQLRSDLEKESTPMFPSTAQSSPLWDGIGSKTSVLIPPKNLDAFEEAKNRINEALKPLQGVSSEELRKRYEEAKSRPDSKFRAEETLNKVSLWLALWGAQEVTVQEAEIRPGAGKGKMFFVQPAYGQKLNAALDALKELEEFLAVTLPEQRESFLKSGEGTGFMEIQPAESMESSA